MKKVLKNYVNYLGVNQNYHQFNLYHLEYMYNVVVGNSLYLLSIRKMFWHDLPTFLINPYANVVFDLRKRVALITLNISIKQFPKLSDIVPL